MQHSLESVELWDHNSLDQENLKPVAIVLEDKDPEDNV